MKDIERLKRKLDKDCQASYIDENGDIKNLYTKEYILKKIDEVLNED